MPLDTGLCVLVWNVRSLVRLVICGSPMKSLSINISSVTILARVCLSASWIATVRRLSTGAISATDGFIGENDLINLSIFGVYSLKNDGMK